MTAFLATEDYYHRSGAYSAKSPTPGETFIDNTRQYIQVRYIVFLLSYQETNTNSCLVYSSISMMSPSFSITTLFLVGD